jgi:1-pyrroline-5-carboxylate dehydrogenase
VNVIKVENEPILQYKKGSKELKELLSAIRDLESASYDVPIIVNGKEIRTGNKLTQVSPFNHAKSVASFYHADYAIISNAISESQKVRADWDTVPMSERIKMFLRAGDLVSGKYRMKLNAATMLGQAKTLIQAEIDAAAELADFFRFNAMYVTELMQFQPLSPEPGISKNTFRYRSLEGFVASISPFNFTAIGGNLATAPAMMGNVVLWKPSDTAILSNYIIYKLLEEAGFPPGVINFIPADGPTFGDAITSSKFLSGINFTGSVPTFKHLWQATAKKLDIYHSFPRLVGECGGKNFHLIHPSADVETVVAATTRSAFEFSGQKCSACSRAYVPASLWPKVKERLIETHKTLKLGSPLQLDAFLSAVIDEKAFARISSYIQYARQSNDVDVIAGGVCDDRVGYYVEPTIVQVKDPRDKLMREEIFGPVLSVFVYPDKDLPQILDLVSTTTDYALTGAVFAQDKKFLSEATQRLKYAAGNFYVNDKCTGSVVGQQPFGGSRMSGTNDKAGGPHYLLRWASPQNVKQTFVPQREVKYPYMD